MECWWKFPPTFHYHHIYAFVPYCITYVSYFITYVPYNYSYMYNYITEFFNIKICLILKRGRFIQPIPSRGVGYARDHCVLFGERQLVCDAIGLSWPWLARKQMVRRTYLQARIQRRTYWFKKINKLFVHVCSHSLGYARRFHIHLPGSACSTIIPPPGLGVLGKCDEQNLSNEKLLYFFDTLMNTNRKQWKSMNLKRDHRSLWIYYIILWTCLYW